MYERLAPGATGHRSGTSSTEASCRVACVTYPSAAAAHSGRSGAYASRRRRRRDRTRNRRRLTEDFAARARDGPSVVQRDARDGQRKRRRGGVRRDGRRGRQSRVHRRRFVSRRFAFAFVRGAEDSGVGGRRLAPNAVTGKPWRGRPPAATAASPAPSAPSVSVRAHVDRAGWRRRRADAPRRRATRPGSLRAKTRERASPLARFQFRRAPSRSRRPTSRVSIASLGAGPLRSRRARRGVEDRVRLDARNRVTRVRIVSAQTRRRALDVGAHARLQARRRHRRRPQAPGRVEDRLRGHPDLPRRRARGCWVDGIGHGIGHIGHVSVRGSRGGIGARRRKRKARFGRRRRRGVVARLGGFRGGQKRGPGFRARHDPSVVWVQRISLE